MQLHDAGPDQRRRSRSGTAGFALPAAILALVVVGVLITGGIQLATQESRIGQATERSTRAFYLAESALHSVLANWTPAGSTLEIWGDPAVRSGVANGGEWEAEIHRVDDQLFFVRTTGSLPAGAGVVAQRSLGVMARVLTVDLEPPAALMTMGSVRVSGSAQIRGNDQVPPDWGGDQCSDPLEDLPGVVTDGTGTVETDGAALVSGSPSGHVADGTLTDDDFTQFGDLSWDELTALATLTLPAGNYLGTAPSLTAGGACNTADTYNWGDPENPDAPCGSYFPIVHIQGNGRLAGGGRGQGILLVDGDLEMTGGFHFYGIIIVQGALGVSGGGANGPRIFGAVMSRNADVEMEITNEEDQSFVGSSIVQNSRCSIRRAIQNNSALNRMVPLADRSWVDLTGASF